MRDMKGNNNFYKCIGSKRKTGKNVGSLLNGVENLVMKDAEQAEVLSVFFALAFTDETCLQTPQARETRGKLSSKENLRSEEEGQTMKYLDKPDICKFMGPDWVHP